MKLPKFCLGALLWVGFFISHPVGGLAQDQGELWEQGEKIYAARCADCHRRNGQGLPNVFPALAQNGFVTGDPQGVIQILLEGRRGSMGRMPAWKALLNDQQIAAVSTYIRQAWGNQATAVTPEMVAKQRR
jgi:mono/diheme cytochrome c family protein